MILIWNNPWKGIIRRYDFILFFRISCFSLIALLNGHGLEDMTTLLPLNSNNARLSRAKAFDLFDTSFVTVVVVVVVYESGDGD